MTDERERESYIIDCHTEVRAGDPTLFTFYDGDRAIVRLKGYHILPSETVDAERETLSALRAELADLEAANDTREREAGYGDGNLWRFWRDQARRVVKKADEADALRAELEEAMAVMVDIADECSPRLGHWYRARARAFLDRGR